MRGRTRGGGEGVGPGFGLSNRAFDVVAGREAGEVVGGGSLV